MSHDNKPWQPGEKVLMTRRHHGPHVVAIDRVTPSGRAVIDGMYFNPCLGGMAYQRGESLAYGRARIRRLTAEEKVKLVAEQARKGLVTTLYNKLSRNAPYSWRGRKAESSPWHKLSDEQLQDLLDTINQDD